MDIVIDVVEVINEFTDEDEDDVEAEEEEEGGREDAEGGVTYFMASMRMIPRQRVLEETRLRRPISTRSSTNLMTSRQRAAHL